MEYVNSLNTRRNIEKVPLLSGRRILYINVRHGPAVGDILVPFEAFL